MGKSEKLKWKTNWSCSDKTAAPVFILCFCKLMHTNQVTSCCNIHFRIFHFFNMNDTIRYSRALWVLVCFYFMFSFSASLLLARIPVDYSYQPAKLLLSFFSIASFLLPVLMVRKLFSNEVHPLFNRWRNPSKTAILISITAMLCTIVVMHWLGYVNQQVPIWSALKESEMKAHEKMQAYMKMDSMAVLIYNLVIFSVIPSVCEEIFFRGTMQPLWRRILGGKIAAVMVTAAIFSLFHFEFLGFLPRFFAGIVLGTIFLFSNSIALTIFCHFIYNSSIVIFSYLEQHSSFRAQVLQQYLVHPVFVLCAAVLTAMLLMRLRKTASFSLRPD
jgi:membrane protease YdiL (CAAX protease family)